MVEYLYAITSFRDKGYTKYELVKEKVKKETKKCYWLEDWGSDAFNFRKQIPKQNAHLTPEHAINAYRVYLQEKANGYEASLADAKTKLATLECTFKEIT